jgi:hypothetical protein
VEGRGVHPVDRRVEIAPDGEIGRGLTSREWSFLTAGRELVGQRAVFTEAGEHIGSGQRGESAQGPYSQPPQQVGELGPVEGVDRKRREELRCPVRRHDVARGVGVGKAPVGKALPGKRAARTVTAVDAAPEMIELARRRLRGQEVEFVVADVFEWLPPRRFDTVFSSRFGSPMCPASVSRCSGRGSGGVSWRATG